MKIGKKAIRTENIFHTNLLSDEKQCLIGGLSSVEESLLFYC